MAVEQNITAANLWFLGEHKLLEFEVLADDGLEVDDPLKTLIDVTGGDFLFAVKRNDTSDPIVFEITNLTGISVTGVYNASRALNTQRITVDIVGSVTIDLLAYAYRYSLNRLDAEAILAFGDAVLLDSAGS